jgi:hypothetical protein
MRQVYTTVVYPVDVHLVALNVKLLMILLKGIVSYIIALLFCKEYLVGSCLYIVDTSQADSQAYSQATALRNEYDNGKSKFGIPTDH